MKKNKNQHNIPELLKRFLLDHLHSHQNASLNTIGAYRDTFRLLLEYLQKHCHVRPEKVAIKDLSTKNILGFLDYLQKERKNSIRTRNMRLAVIRSFVNYLLLIDPTLNGELYGVLSIPVKKTSKTILDYLTREEMNSILEAPDEHTFIGQRDRVLLLVMYNTGARVSEISQIKVSDIKFNARSANIHLFGKGRKQRSLPLWKNTTKVLRQWIDKNKYTSEMSVFQSKRGTTLTRFVISNRLSVNVAKASKKNPSLKKKTVSPHTIRHTTAMHFLQSGIDIATIAMWLGHESIETTQIYIAADMEMKEKALKSLHEPETKRFRYKPSDSLLTFLENL